MSLSALLLSFSFLNPSPSVAAEAARMRANWRTVVGRADRFARDESVGRALAGGGIALDRASLFRSADEALAGAPAGSGLILFAPSGEAVAWGGRAPTFVPTGRREGAIWSASAVVFYQDRSLGGGGATRLVVTWRVPRDVGQSRLEPLGGTFWRRGPGAERWGTLRADGGVTEERGLVERRRAGRAIFFAGALALLAAAILRRPRPVVAGRAAAALALGWAALGAALTPSPPEGLAMASAFRTPALLFGFAMAVLAAGLSLSRGEPRPRWRWAGALAVAGFLAGTFPKPSPLSAGAAFAFGLGALLCAGGGPSRSAGRIAAPVLAAAVLFGPALLWHDEHREARQAETRRRMAAIPVDAALEQAASRVPRALEELAAGFRGAKDEDLSDLAYALWKRTEISDAAPVSGIRLWHEGRIVSQFSVGIPFDDSPRATVGSRTVEVSRRRISLPPAGGFLPGENPDEAEIEIGAWPADQLLPSPFREYRELLLAPGRSPAEPAAPNREARFIEAFNAATAAALAVSLVFAAGAVLAWSRRRPPLRLWPRTFRGRITAIFTLLVLLPFLAAAIFIRLSLARRLEQETLLHAQTALGTARTVLDDYLFASGTSPGRRQLLDDDLLGWMAKVIGHDLSIYADGRLYSTNRRELFSSGLLPERLSGSSLARLLGSGDRFVVESRRLRGRPFDQVEAALASLSGRMTLAGPAVLSIPLLPEQRETEQEIARLSASLTAFTLLVFGLSLVVGARTAYRVTGPISNLVEGTRRVARGETPQIPEPADAELRLLVEAFLSMSQTLAEQRVELARGERLRAWAEMARMIAHEIKNPLTPIRLSAEHVLALWERNDPTFDRVLRECLRNILGQTEVLRSIASEFADYARLPAPSREALAVRPLLEEAAAGFVGAPGIRWSISAESELTVYADRRLLERALANLVENARQALGPDGGRIGLLAHRDGGDVVFRVEDDGPGVPEESVERLFDPYFSTKSAGTGLGLAIVRKIAEEHGGSARAMNLRPRGFAVEFSVRAGQVSS